MNWLDRTWIFLDTEKNYDHHLGILGNTSPRLTELSAGLEKDQLRFQPEGKWSINQHTGHLLTIESLWIARLDDFILGNESLRPWNGTNADTESGEFNQQRLGKIIEDFDAIRIAHIRMLSTLHDKAASLQSIHPRLNELISLADHIFFMAEHDLHHLATIQKIRNSL